MQKIMNFLQNKVMDKTVKLVENDYLAAVRNGMMVLIPFTIIGSLFTIVTNFPLESWMNWIAPYASYIQVGSDLTFGMMAIVSVMAIAYHLAGSLKTNKLSATVIALLCFIMLQVSPDTFQITTENFGSSGLFTSILVGLLVPKVIQLFEKKKLIIRLPKSVPNYVADSFTMLIPTFVLIVIFWFIRIILRIDVNNIIITILSPLMKSLNTLPGILLLFLISLLCWSVGINGESIISGVYYPVTLGFLAENIAAKAAGKPLPYITADGFGYFGMWVGGTGCVIVLAFLMLTSKSKQYKAIGKVAFPPTIFHITEPVMFGFPVVLNPIIAIPFILSPLVLSCLTYALMYFNLISRPITAIPWTTPPFINVYIATGFDWRAVVWQAVEFVIIFLIYLPFFKVAEKEQLAKESELEEQEKSE